MGCRLDILPNVSPSQRTILPVKPSSKIVNNRAFPRWARIAELKKARWATFPFQVKAKFSELYIRSIWDAQAACCGMLKLKPPSRFRAAFVAADLVERHQAHVAISGLRAVSRKSWSADSLSSKKPFLTRFLMISHIVAREWPQTRFQGVFNSLTYPIRVIGNGKGMFTNILRHVPHQKY